MENEKTSKMLLDTVHTEIYHSFIDPLCKSLNYEYLGPLIEEMVEEIPGIVSKEIEILPRKKNNLLQKKRDDLIELSSEKIDIKNYYQILKKIYEGKISNQQEMGVLGKIYQQKGITFSFLCERGGILIKKGLDLEPTFFAITELAKQHVDKETNTIIKKYGDYLSNDEVFLLNTPLATDFFTKRFLDVQSFLENPCEESEKLLKTRYGRNLFNKKWFKQQKLDTLQKRDIENKMKQNFCKKYYFLLERKIPNLEIIDYILTIDHIVDKHIQANFSFMHDIFLQMQILNGKERISELEDKEKIKHLMVESIKELLKNY